MLLKPPTIPGQPTPVPSLISALPTTGIDPNTVLVRFQTAISGLTHNAALDGITLAGLLIIIYASMNMFSSSSNVTKRDGNNQRLFNVLIYAGVIAATGIFIQVAIGFGSLLT